VRRFTDACRRLMMYVSIDLLQQLPEIATTMALAGKICLAADRKPAITIIVTDNNTTVHGEPPEDMCCLVTMEDITKMPITVRVFYVLVMTTSDSDAHSILIFLVISLFYNHALTHS
jgi:hypothetical protein